MKRRVSLIFITFLMLVISSCERPDALVINIVHSDGSVMREIILTHTKDEFDLYDCQVPVDSTWNITMDYDISEKGDTTYTLTAVKEFESVKGINALYSEYEGSNPRMKREAEFQKKFRWFTTLYRYTEHVDKAIDGYSPEDFFTEEELDFFYMPDKLVEARLEEADSTQVKKNIIEPMEEKFDIWLGRSLVKAMIGKIADTVSVDPNIDIDIKILQEKEEAIAESILISELDEAQVLDSLLREDYYESNRVLLDTVFSQLEKDFDIAFSAQKYMIQTVMPGQLIATNGYIDENGNVVWEVEGDVILSTDYDMWAESRERNTWAWIVTGVFLVFVISGLIIRILRK